LLPLFIHFLHFLPHSFPFISFLHFSYLHLLPSFLPYFTLFFQPSFVSFCDTPPSVLCSFLDTLSSFLHFLPSVP
jgi:hypothetical protein